MHKAYAHGEDSWTPPQVFQLRKIDALRSMHTAHFARLYIYIYIYIIFFSSSSLLALQSIPLLPPSPYPSQKPLQLPTPDLYTLIRVNIISLYIFVSDTRFTLKYLAQVVQKPIYLIIRGVSRSERNWVGGGWVDGGG